MSAKPAEPADTVVRILLRDPRDGRAAVFGAARLPGGRARLTVDTGNGVDDGISMAEEFPSEDAMMERLARLARGYTAAGYALADVCEWPALADMLRD
jgi:hypothetical protein